MICLRQFPWKCRHVKLEWSCKGLMKQGLAKACSFVFSLYFPLEIPDWTGSRRILGKNIGHQFSSHKPYWLIPTQWLCFPSKGCAPSPSKINEGLVTFPRLLYSDYSQQCSM